MAIVCGTSKCRKGFRKARQAASFPGDDIVLNDAIGIIFSIFQVAFKTTAYDFVWTCCLIKNGKICEMQLCMMHSL